MVISFKSSNNLILYEKLGQLNLFGRDNLSFKVVNMPVPQRYDNMCSKFRLKKIIKKKIIKFSTFSIKIK